MLQLLSHVFGLTNVKIWLLVFPFPLENNFCLNGRFENEQQVRS